MRRMPSFLFTLGLAIGLLVPSSSVAVAALQEPSEGEGEVNVEIIVDASGSMAAATDTDEVRMDAAQRVLNEVINTMPEANGVNVGLRVYGHEGDNTEAGRAESCASSELIVPIDGVQREELLTQVSQIQPTGWTPLAYSIEEATADLEAVSGPDDENAIVLVTDGLETCDGDPGAAAEAAFASDIEVITHVIGFATTPEEQTVLDDISTSGGGELLSASNAGQLMGALFEILEDLEVVEETGTGESRESPLGIGRIGEVGDYEVNVVSITPVADDIVATENQFNDPPADGNQFFMARVSMTYNGDETGLPWIDLDYQAVGDLNVGYSVHGNTCGVYPDQGYEISDVFPGGTVEFNVCWEVDGNDAESLVMYVENLLGQDRVWYSLGNPTPVIAVEEEEAAEEPEPAAEEEMEDATPEAPAAPSADAEVPGGDSREAPLPVGTSATLGDYEVHVVSVTPFADEIVAAENQFNDPSGEGNQFYMARVAVTYTGDDTGTPWIDLDFQTVGDLNTGYSTYNDTCGVIPDEGYSVGDLFAGGAAEFNVCWEVDSQDTDSLVMYVDEFMSFSDSDRVWFTLEP